MKGGNNMKDKRYWYIILSIFILFGFSGCSSGNISSNESLKKLAATEVKEYNGKKLSSITDFIENSIKGPQYIDINIYRLKVDGLVEKPTDFKYADILANTKYTKVVTLNCVDGWSVDILWEGILLKDIFDKVKVKSGANTVIFYAADGYSTSLPLQTILDKNMIIAYKMNNVVLPPERGFPFELVAEDKLGYKWIKWITRIELSNNPDYKGYWEERGFSNGADVKN
jgi:DMSO/TMAO reductase YedYZ molybdopterin-dependent catalytic subunit